MTLDVDGPRPAVAAVAMIPRGWVTNGERLILFAFAADTYDREPPFESAPGVESLVAWTGQHRSTVAAQLTSLASATEVRPPLLRLHQDRGRRTDYELLLDAIPGWDQSGKPGGVDDDDRSGKPGPVVVREVVRVPVREVVRVPVRETRTLPSPSPSPSPVLHELDGARFARAAYGIDPRISLDRFERRVLTPVGVVASLDDARGRSRWVKPQMHDQFSIGPPQHFDTWNYGDLVEHALLVWATTVAEDQEGDIRKVSSGLGRVLATVAEDSDEPRGEYAAARALTDGWNTWAADRLLRYVPLTRLTQDVEAAAGSDGSTTNAVMGDSLADRPCPFRLLVRPDGYAHISWRRGGVVARYQSGTEPDTT